MLQCSSFLFKCIVLGIRPLSTVEDMEKIQKQLCGYFSTCSIIFSVAGSMLFSFSHVPAACLSNTTHRVLLRPVSQTLSLGKPPFQICSDLSFCFCYYSNYLCSFSSFLFSVSSFLISDLITPFTFTLNLHIYFPSLCHFFA